MKIFARSVVAISIALTLVACGNSEDPNKLPNNGVVKDCSGITRNSDITTGAMLDCVTMDGKQISFESLRGPMVVNVYGSWCWPCRNEIPYFRNFYKKHHDKVQLVGIAVEEKQPSDTQNFIKGMGITWPSLYDSTGSTRVNIGMGVPVTVFIDSSGKVVGRIVGAVKSEAILEESTTKYLGVKL